MTVKEYAGHVHTQKRGEKSYLRATQLEAACFVTAGALAGEIGQLPQEVIFAGEKWGPNRPPRSW